MRVHETQAAVVASRRRSVGGCWGSVAGMLSLVMGGLVALVIAASAAAASTPTNTLAPHVSGAASVGATLTTSTGSWSGTDGQYRYEWSDCMPNGGGGCVPATVSTSATYTVQASDVGGTLYVDVSAHNASGWSSWVVSDNTVGPIARVGTPVNTAAPQLSGAAIVGATLTITPGGWTDASDYTYEWWECDPAGCAGSATQIDNASGPSYEVDSSNVGYEIYATVGAYNTFGSSPPVMSNLIGPVTGSQAPLNQEPPQISGNPTVGATLRVDVGTWDGSPDTYAYQWQRCVPSTASISAAVLGSRAAANARRGASCTAIAGATSATYVLAAADVGDQIVVAVSAQNPAGWSDQVVTGPVGPVTSSGGGTGESGGTGGSHGSSGSSPQIKNRGTVSTSLKGKTATVIPAIIVICAAKGPVCAVDVTAQTQVTTRAGRKSVRKWITIAHTKLTVAAGKTTVVSFKLTGRGAALLKSKRALAVNVTTQARIAQTAPVKLVEKITIRQPKAAKKAAATPLASTVSL